MPFLAGDLIDSYVNKVAKISIFQPIVDNVFNSFTYCIPMESKKLTNHIPNYKLGPSSQDHTQRQRKRTFPLSPGDRFHFNATVNALKPSGRISQRNWDTPQRDMLPASFFQRVVSRPFPTTTGTYQPVTSIGKQINHYFTMFFGDLFDAMSLGVPSSFGLKFQRA